MASVGAARDLAPADSDTLPFAMLMVTGSAGSVVIRRRNGDTTTLASVPVGVWVPVGENAVGVNSTGTSASGIMVA